MKKCLLLTCLGIFFIATQLSAQKTADSTTLKTSTNQIDTAQKKKFNPRTATIRSAIIPGWGQIYNKRYWKVPLVWGALGTTAGIFAYNLKYYKLLKNAYININDGDESNNYLIDPRFKNLSPEAIRSYRNSYRQDVDYSALFFLLFWGLNVVDATVDGHLKQFDVNDNLSLQIKPGYSQMANTAGISVVLNIGNSK